MNLEQTVQDQLNLLVGSGRIEEIIKNNLEKTLQAVISDTVSPYSDFGKELKKTVNEAMKINLSQVGVVEYNKIVTDIVKAELDRSLFASVIEPIQAQISCYITDLEKSEWKLSEIIDKFTEDLRSEESEGEITLIVDQSDKYGWVHIYFDKDSNKSKYDCAFQLDINKEGKVYNFTAGTYRKVEKDIRIRPILSSFDAFIFKLYAMECKVTVDEQDCETEWYND